MNELPAPLRPEIASLETSRIQQVFDLGFGRENLIALWVGEGDQPTPAFICDAANDAMKAGKTFYTYKHGIPELRTAIAAYTRDLYGIDCAEERVSAGRWNFTRGYRSCVHERAARASAAGDRELRNFAHTASIRSRSRTRRPDRPVGG